jgi:hypothetical protein
LYRAGLYLLGGVLIRYIKHTVEDTVRDLEPRYKAAVIPRVARVPIRYVGLNAGGKGVREPLIKPFLGDFDFAVAVGQDVPA